MSIDARLNKLAPVLTAKERAILVLGSLKNRTPEDHLWRSTMPRDQVQEFNRLIGLMNAANIKVGFVISHLEQLVENIELRLMWGGTLALAAEYNRPMRRRDRVKRVIDELPLRIEEGAMTVAANQWKQIRAVEIVLHELAAEFDGEYPLRDVHVETLRATKAPIARLRDATPGFELAEPDEDDVEFFRSAVQRWAGS